MFSVVVVGGLDAGRRLPLGVGATALGRGPGGLADSTVSRRHAVVTVAGDGTATITDLGSRNGTWVDGQGLVPGAPAGVGLGQPVRVGASVVAVEGPVDDAPVLVPRPIGEAVPFNRPPRHAGPPPPTPVEVPEPPEPRGPGLPLGVVAVVGPLAMAVVLVVALRNPLFALLALLSPVLAVGNHWESKRRARRTSRRDAARRAADVDRFARALAAAAATEHRRRLHRAPHLGEVLRRAEQPSTRLWERRPSHDDWLALRVGVGAVPWDPPLAGDRHPRPDDVAAVVASAAVLDDCPAAVTLAGGGVVGIVGDRASALAVARSLVCQAAVHHGPADLAVRVFASARAAADWSWLSLLPHAGEEAEVAGHPLVVVDGEELLAGRRSPVRASLAGPASGIVVAATADRLPAACTAVVAVDADGTAEVLEPATGRRLQGVRACGVAADVAERCARALARFDDPELDVPGSGLPAEVRLVDLLAGGAAAPGPVAPIGVAVDGPVELDLVADGPHALVAGTTGAGKSELLRTLVVALATRCTPDELTFVLVDFKGGSAFDACARLPHVVGVVTDLDEDLAARALRCLEAELRHRERVLRAGEPAPPRLVVVVDEFATLKAELPGFVESLVGVAQRGRSLGMHLVLATQRPAGAVSDDIRANTNLRIALRVQDVADAVDVVGVPDAAQLPRRRPGRALVRLGPDEVLAVQVAHAGDDLAALVDACAARWAGRPPPRRPWPDPLPARVDRAGLGGVALADDPDGQRQLPIRWEPAGGNLAVYGVGGSGTTTTLLAVALDLASATGPAGLHLYAVDHGAGGLAVLAGLPHTGAVLGAGDRERQHRLVRWLRAELERRQLAGAREPAVVVLVDGAASFLSVFDGVLGLEAVDAFERAFADGPAVGLHVAVAADRPGALPSALASTVRRRWVHQLADPVDAGVLGVAGRPPALPPGRFVDVASGLVAHVGTPADGWEAAVAACAARWRGEPATAVPIGALPRSVGWTDLGAGASFGDRPWTVPIGVADDDLGPALLPLWPGEHVLVTGPARSGRSTLLATIAAAVTAAGGRVVSGVDVDVDLRAPVPTFVLVDDADRVDDPDRRLAALVAAAPAHVHVVAAGRAEALRGLYDHWTRGVRRSRLGVLLQPHVDLDGDLLATSLPRRAAVPLVAGRGYLVADGAARLVHVALPG